MSDPQTSETPEPRIPSPPPSPDAQPPEELMLLPMRSAPLFPDVVWPITVGRTGSIEAVRTAIQQHQPIGIVLQRDETVDAPELADLHEVGTLADVVRYVSNPEGPHHVILHGRQRFRIRQGLGTTPVLSARVEYLEEPGEAEERDTEVQARFLHLKALVREALSLMTQQPEGLEAVLAQTASPLAFTNLVATFVDLPAADKQELLELDDLRQRLARLSDAVARQLEILRLSQQIGEKTRGTLSQRQREGFLREQLRTIRRELGEEAGQEDLDELAQAIEGSGMPEEVQAEAHKELRRLAAMPEGSAEAGITRTYLQWLIDAPWTLEEAPEIDIASARKILDEDHEGLARVKRRILEFLAVRKLNPEGKSPILCLVGPPGVGKTSLGRSIARATGRKFARLSLGGVHDEAEIRGHRRTYVGAMPGQILRTLVQVGTRSPVFMLDEIDKLGRSIHGDPASALLEVLDPEQNQTFRDTYLGVPFDLSRVLFIATANQLDTIPGPLRDRFEVIEIAGYTEDEKLRIAERYLLGRQIQQNGLDQSQIDIPSEVLRAVIRDYTREAGCRELERNIAALCRSVATRVAEGTAEHVTLTPADLREILGRPRYANEVALRTSLPGVATGLAWTPVGGTLLFIEASATPGSGKLTLTGQLGEVMRESAQAAITSVKLRAEELGIAADYFERHDLHVHVPEGATPKDGPSAGTALFAALASLLTGRRVRPDLAMTGEITLRGLVLPVGGIKEKVLAAHRAGIRTVLLPTRNQADLEDIPEPTLNELEIIPIDRVQQILEYALSGS